jgi:hypothetical protein
MSNFDEERESLREARERAEQSAKRASQKYEIVLNQQGDLWRRLDQKALDATQAINTGGIELRLSQPKREIGFILEPARAGKKPIATAKFDQKLHRVVIEFSGLGSSEKVIYEIQANDENKAEFVDSTGSTIGEETIVKEILAWLR